MNFEYWKKTKEMKPFQSIEEFTQFEKDLIAGYGYSGIPKPAAMGRPIAKKGTASGTQYDSFAEFTFHTYMTKIEHASVERNYKEHFLYYYDEENKQRKYYPDFIVNGTYAEVKGRYSAKDARKKEQHPEVAWYFQEDIDKMAEILDEKLGRQWRNEFIQTNITKND